MPATFLHISDLHIGDITPLGKKSYSDPNAVAALNLYQYLPGNLGHSDRALMAVNRLWRDLKRRHGANAVSVIVTGDVTAFGKQEHFDAADDFLYGTFPVGKRRRLGLSLGTKQGTIPGNHDYFAGNPIPIGRQTGHFTSFFRPLPSASWTVPLPDGRQLRLLEIDCDWDFEIHGHAPRLAARASGREHLMQLDSQLRTLPADPDEPRILIIHGSPTYHNGLLKICELMYAAQRYLQPFCAAHRVKAILCGHVHSTFLGAIPWPTGAAGTDELRCGTSMQVLKPNINPVTRRLVRRFFPRLNQALVHRIVQDGGVVYWETQEYFRRSSDRRFQAATATRRLQL